MREETMSQKRAWSVYDLLLDDERIVLLDEPAGIEEVFRAYSQSVDPSAKQWADAYIAAFATAAELILVTFDRGLKMLVKDAVLLQGNGQ